MITRITVGLVALVGLVFDAHPTQTAKAYGPEEEALIRRGIEYRKAQDDLSARAQFQKAYDLTHSPRAAAQLGLAEFALGRWEDAEAHVSEALRTPSDPFITKYRGELDESLATIKGHVARVEIIGDPPGSEVFVNGRPAGRLPLADPVAVSAGQVEVELRATGFKAASRTVTLSGGQYQRLVLRLEATPPVASASPESKGSDPRPTSTDGPAPSGDGALTPAGDGSEVRRAAKWTALGLAGAGVVTGVTATIVYQTNLKTFEGLHGGGCFDDGGRAVDADGINVPECQSSLSTYRTARTWQIVGFASAGAFAAAWLVLTLTEPTPDSASTTGAGPRASSRVQWACVPSFLTGPAAICAMRF